MYQVTFSEQAMRELNKLDKLTQLDAISPISGLRASDLASPREPLGRFARGGQMLYRLRAGEFRFACLIAGHYSAGMVGRITVAPRNAR